MSIRDNLEAGMRAKKAIGSDEVVERFTEALTVSLDKFLSRLNNGQIPIEDMTDLHRVYTMWKEIVEFNELREGGSGSGMLPEIKTSEIRALEDSGIVSDEGGTVNLEEKSQEELEQLAINLMNAVNMENEKEM